jgi:hypothetical protein
MDRRFVRLEDLICEGCDEQVRPEPPAYWRVADGLPAPQWSHQDGTPLCDLAREPIEIRTEVVSS